MNQAYKNNKNVSLPAAIDVTMFDGKMPPNSVDFERLIIGTLLIDKNAINKVKKRFSDREGVFYDPKHQLIFKAITDLQNKDFPVDIMTVIQELKRTDVLTNAGGDNYIIDLTMGISSSAHLDYHLMMVLQKFLARKIIASCTETINMLYKESTDVFEQIDLHIEDVNEIEEIIAQQKDSPTSLDLHKKLIKQQVDKIIPGIPSKHRSVDKKLSGWRNGNFIVIGARPAMGKTTFILDDVFHMAKRGEPVGFFSLEMGADELHQKMVSNETEIPGNALRDRALNDLQMQKLYETGIFDNLPFYIEDSVFDINQILAKARLMKKEKGIKIIVVDYLQLVEYNSKGMNREQSISFISRKFKQLAKELDIPVIALSQLSRSVEQRPNKRPMLSDLRESGAIEQDADIVAFLYRPEYYKIDTWDREWDGYSDLPTQNEVEVIFAKFRGGGVFEERLKFRGDYSKFFDLQTDFGTYSNPVPYGNPSEAFEIGKKIDDDNEFKF